MIDLTALCPLNSRLDRIDARLGRVEGRLDRVECQPKDHIDRTLERFVESDRAHREATKRADESAERLQILSFGAIVAATGAVIVKIIADAMAGG